MKVLALGDIHGRTVWFDIINKENPDLIIFMGDYVSTHDKNISWEQQCSNLENILNYKKENPDKVILLRGNHDIQHLGYYWAQCSGYFHQVSKYMQSIKEQFLELTQWVYIYDDVVFSHAGITHDFFSYLNLGTPTKGNILKINDLEPSSIFGFTPSHYGDCCGDSTTQPLTWVRPMTLAENHIGWIQVVGHTRIISPGILFADDKPDWATIPELWCIDALPDWYMIIDSGKKIMKKYEQYK